MRLSYAELNKILDDATGNSGALYRDESSYPLPRAQRALQGRTHYVDSDTLRFHHSRVLGSRVLMDGAFFVITESCALDYRNTKRGFRVVVFDIFGRTVLRDKLDDAWRTRAQAEKHFSHWLEAFDAESYYRVALAERSDRLMREATAMAKGSQALAFLDNVAA